jgi:hypothetical protein
MRRLPKKQTAAGLVGGHEKRDWPGSPVQQEVPTGTDAAVIGRGKPRTSVTCPAGEQRMAGWQWRELDAIGPGWTSRDLIQQVRRADQAHSETTDTTRTAGGFHLA